MIEWMGATRGVIGWYDRGRDRPSTRSGVLLATPAHQKSAADDRDDQHDDAYPLHKAPP
jgi:hypothetical protein